MTTKEQGLPEAKHHGFGRMPMELNGKTYLFDARDAQVWNWCREAAALASNTGERGVPAIDVFRIAGGDVECCPEPTAEQALECLRDLRECYAEALRAQPAGGGEWDDGYKAAIDDVAQMYPATPPESGGQGKAVAWQWRKKGDAWRLSYTFDHEVFATTDDSETRALYTHPPAQAAEAVLAAVANAIAREDSGYSADELSVAAASGYRRMARAAIAAMQAGG